MPTLDFFYERNEVGSFQGPSFPRSDGPVRYEPYRGPGHYDMQQALRSQGVARCYFIDGAERISFTARSTGAYGQLDLSEFRAERSRED